MESATVSEVAVPAETVPAAPSLNVTVSLAAFESKPRPSMVTVVAVATRSAALLVTTGVTVATCTGVPLLTMSEVTTAFITPARTGAVESATVSEVEVAPMTVPDAPSSKLTLLLETIGSKPEPLMTMAVASTAKFEVSGVTLTLSMARSSRHSK